MPTVSYIAAIAYKADLQCLTQYCESVTLVMKQTGKWHREWAHTASAEPSLSLDKAIKIALAMESADCNANDVQKPQAVATCSKETVTLKSSWPELTNCQVSSLWGDGTKKCTYAAAKSC